MIKLFNCYFRFHSKVALIGKFGIRLIYVLVAMAVLAASTSDAKQVSTPLAETGTIIVKQQTDPDGLYTEFTFFFRKD